jgi:hypothetical protein
MECFGTTDFDNNSRLIALSASIIRGLHYIFLFNKPTTYLILSLITPILFSEHYKSCTFALRSFLLSCLYVLPVGLPPPALNTLCLCSSLRVSDQVLHPYNKKLVGRVAQSV